MTIFNVSTRAELLSALNSAKGGDVISLEGGNYGSLTLSSSNGSFNKTVTITSASDSNPASFSSIQLTGAKNIKFDGINFDYNYSSGDARNYMPFRVDSSSKITFTNGEIIGDNDGTGYPTGYGLFINNSDKVTVSNMEIYTLFRALVVDGSTNIKIKGNDVYDIKGDGMNFSDVQGVVISNNYIHDFRSDLTMEQFHRDMIQFWTTGTDSPSTNITIEKNRLDVGDGVYTQLIFIRNEVVDGGSAGYEMYYKNITIKDNQIFGSHYHGITVGETDGLVIMNNIVVRADTNQAWADNQDRADGISTPQINVSSASQAVKIIGNLVAALSTDAQDGWDVTANVFVSGRGYTVSSDDNGFLGSRENDTYSGNGSDNWFSGVGGNDRLDGKGGNDVLAGGLGADVISGGAGGDLLDGGYGSDKIKGGYGRDMIFGGGGKDTIKGAAGADEIEGGKGKDTMSGGRDADTFVFSRIGDTSDKIAKADVITDFRPGEDKIDLQDIDASSVLSGNNTFVWLGTGNPGTQSSGAVTYRQVDNAGTSNDFTLVQIDRDGDADYEAYIKLDGLLTLAANDFIL